MSDSPTHVPDVCPKCGRPEAEFRTTNTRKHAGGSLIIRYRRCATPGCGGRLVVESRVTEVRRVRVPRGTDMPD